MSTERAGVLAKPAQSSGRLLVIEPDVSRALALRKVLAQCDDIELEIVETVAAARRRLDEQIPDVVLTSTFLAPAEEAPLTAYLNQMPAAAHVQVISLPYFIDSESGAVPSRSPNSSPGRLLSVFRRRELRVPEESPRPRSDAQMLRQQIAEYITKARAIQLELRERQSSQVLCLYLEARSPEMRISRETTPFSSARSLMPEAGLVHVGRSAAAMPTDRRRSRRRRGGELAWLQNAKLPGISQIRVIDISSRGVLFETTSKMLPGSRFDLQLLGEHTEICVPARMLRDQMLAVDGPGVRYHVAAVFGREVDLPRTQPISASALSPKALGTVLTRVLGELDQGRGASGLRETFEQEMRRLLPVRDIQIRRSPRVSDGEAESIYFAVPTGSGSPPILQATFERNHVPTALELQLLKAAAIIAAVVLEFESFGGAADRR